MTTKQYIKILDKHNEHTTDLVALRNLLILDKANLERHDEIISMWRKIFDFSRTEQRAIQDEAVKHIASERKCTEAEALKMLIEGKL